MTVAKDNPETSNTETRDQEFDQRFQSHNPSTTAGVPTRSLSIIFCITMFVRHCRFSRAHPYPSVRSHRPQLPFDLRSE